MSGISGYLADACVNVLRGVTFTGIAGLWVKVHTGEPGSAGTTNAALITTRQPLTLLAPSAGTGIATLDTLGTFTGIGTEDLTHVSLWDTVGPAGGTFLGSGPLAATKHMNVGDLLTFDTFDVSFGPVA